MTVSVGVRLYVDNAKPGCVMRGYFGRGIRRIWRYRNPYLAWLALFGLWWFIARVLDLAVGPAVEQVVFWSGYIGQALDDYFFGDDDDRRRFWEGVRNRVKWKMELPRRQPTGTGTA